MHQVDAMQNDSDAKEIFQKEVANVNGLTLKKIKDLSEDAYEILVIYS